MNPSHYGIIEMVFSGAVVLGLGFWQLWSVCREQARDRAEAERRASMESARHPVRKHRLDDR